MKDIVKKMGIPFGSALIGGFIALAVVKTSPTLQAKLLGERSLGRPQHALDEDDFFGMPDPFEQMRRMQNQMQNIQFHGAAISDIAEREDDQYVYYDITVPDLNATSINTKISDGYLTITGTIEKKSSDDEENSGMQSVFHSTFNRTVPLPENVDEDKMEMVPEKDKVVLKFPKIKA